MIEYAVLCKAIEEWKSGRPASPVAATRPAIPTRQAAPAEEPEEVVEYSGMYESGEAGEAVEAVEAPAEPQESTVIYQLPDYENVDVNEDDR
jgi:hypothetical protein